MERRQHALFRFDPIGHVYYDLEGRIIPHITGMLKDGGWVDDTWFTEEGSIRGTAVHDLTADFDHGALEPERVVSKYRSWLLAYVEAMKLLRPDWKHIEEAMVHPVLRYGGRPDNVGTIFGRWTVLEKKTGGNPLVTNPQTKMRLRSVGIQLALQAILVSARYPLPAPEWDRRAIFLRESGKYSLESYTDNRDFDEAYRLIQVYGGTSNGEKATAAAGVNAGAALASSGGRGRKPRRATLGDRRGCDHDRTAYVPVPSAGDAARKAWLNA